MTDEKKGQEVEKEMKAPKAKKEEKVTIDQLTAFVQELAHFTGQERLLTKYGIPKMTDAHKVDYRKAS